MTCREDDAVPSRPTPQPGPRPGPEPAPPPAPRPGAWRRLWTPLALAGAVAAVAVTAALGGVPLPGTGDTAGSPAQSRSAPTPSDPLGAAASPPAVLPPVALPPVVLPPVVLPPQGTTASADPTPPAPTPAPAPAPAPPPAPAPAPAPPPAPAPAPAPAAQPPAPRPAPAPPPAAPGPEGQVLALVNAERTAAGCGPVAADAGLAAVARAHSADMRDRGFFAHTDPDGLDPFARARAAGISSARAENIAAGQPDAAAVMAAWMASPGHRQNVLNCSLGRLGVGVATGTGGPWWTQLFGS